MCKYLDYQCLICSPSCKNLCSEHSVSSQYHDKIECIECLVSNVFSLTRSQASFCHEFSTNTHCIYKPMENGN